MIFRWLASVFTLVTLCQGDPIPLPEYKITSIERPAIGKVKFCLSEKIDVDFEHCLFMTTIGETTETQEQIEFPKDSNCITFPEDITNWEGEDRSFVFDFLKDTGDSTDVVVATASLEISRFPEFPATFPTASSVKDPAGDKNTKVLRIEGNVGKDFEDENLSELSSVTQDVISYYVGFTGDTVSPCYAEEGVTVCDKTIEVVNTDDPKIPTVTSGILQYTEEDKYHLIIDAKLITETNKAEFIIEDQEGNLNSFLEATDSFDIAWKHSEKDTVKIRVLGIDTNEASIKEIASNPIPDRDLSVIQLGNDILEGRWKMWKELDDDNDDKGFYYTMELLMESNDEDDKDVKIVEVDCTPISKNFDHCFGYFPFVAEGTYTTRVQVKDKDNEQIESIPTEIKSSNQQGLNIHPPRIISGENSSKLSVVICFDQRKLEGSDWRSHYEVLLINQKGQWLREQDISGNQEGEFCFKPLSIDTGKFDIDEEPKVVITQRGRDGFSVVATGGRSLL